MCYVMKIQPKNKQTEIEDIELQALNSDWWEMLAADAKELTIAISAVFQRNTEGTKMYLIGSTIKENIHILCLTGHSINTNFGLHGFLDSSCQPWLLGY